MSFFTKRKRYPDAQREFLARVEDGSTGQLVDHKWSRLLRAAISRIAGITEAARDHPMC
jgi:hypothetical protein